MYYSRSLHRRFDPPLPRYPSLVDDSEDITLTAPRRRLPFPRPPFRSARLSRRARLVVIACGAAALAFGVVFWLALTVLVADREAPGPERQLATAGQSVVPATHNRVAGGQIDEPPPVMRAEDLPILGPNEQRAAEPDQQAPIARRRPR
jgi:hypothetical protein